MNIITAEQVLKKSARWILKFFIIKPHLYYPSYYFSGDVHSQLRCNIVLKLPDNHYILLMDEKYSYPNGIDNQPKLVLSHWNFPIKPIQMFCGSSWITCLFPWEFYFSGLLTMSRMSRYHFCSEVPNLSEDFGKLANFDCKISSHNGRSIGYIYIKECLILIPQIRLQTECLNNFSVHWA